MTLSPQRGHGSPPNTGAGDSISKAVQLRHTIPEVSRVGHFRITEGDLSSFG